MSSFKNAVKANRRTHRERNQPAAREHLGLLEKKKDYKQRAVDFQKKKATLKALKKKALDRNPDEFYFKMIRSRVKDGIHETPENEPELSEAQEKLLKTQDIKYVNYKRSTELKKIERLKSTLHLLDSDTTQNSHIFFVDTKKEARNFNLAERLDTHPDLSGRTYNRPRISTLKEQKVHGLADKETLEEISETRNKQYKELSRRIERERELHIVSQKMELQRNLLDRKSRKKKICDETASAPAQYRWVPQRKR